MTTLAERSGNRLGRQGHGKHRSSVVHYEVLLREMLGAAGVAHLPAGCRDSRRLACNMTLFRELISAKAFGPLQSIMESILTEISTCLYSDQVCAEASPQILAMCPSAEKEISKVPFFVEVGSSKEEKETMAAELSVMREQRSESEKNCSELQQKCLSMKSREDQLVSEMQVLESQLDRVQGELTRLQGSRRDEEEKNAEELRKAREECAKWHEAADRAKLELSFIKNQREEDQSLREAFYAMHLTTNDPGVTEVSKHTPSETIRTLHDQLMILLHTRIDEFETCLMECAGPFEEERLREQFIGEASSVNKEITALKTYMENRPKDGEGIAVPLARGRSKAILVQMDGPGGVSGEIDPHASLKYLFPDELVEKVQREEANAGGFANDGALNQGDPLWRGFLQRCDPTFHIPIRARDVQLHRLLNLIEDILSAKHERDDSMLIVEPTCDFFYSFMHDMYGVPHVAMVVIHGVLTSTCNLRNQHPIIGMFAEIMTGSLEEAAWKYSMHWRYLLKQCPVMCMHDLRHFLAKLYPRYAEQEVSDFLKEFHDTHPFCTSDNVLAFLTGKLLEKSEIRLRKWVRVLRWRDSEHSGGMGRSGFLEMAHELFPTVPDAFVRFYFDALPEKHGHVRVPLESLAVTCCFLDVCVDDTKTNEKSARTK